MRAIGMDMSFCSVEYDYGLWGRLETWLWFSGRPWTLWACRAFLRRNANLSILHWALRAKLSPMTDLRAAYKLLTVQY